MIRIGRLTALLLPAVMAVSCVKEEPGCLDGNETVKYKTVAFETMATKTAVDVDGNVAWEKGDEISVYYVNASGEVTSAVATASSAGAVVTFYAEIPETDEPEYYYASYPKGKGTLTIDGGTPQFTINVTGSSCDGTFRKANFAAAYTQTGTLQFHNAVGMVKVTLPEGGKVSNDGKDYPITGIYLRCKATSVILNGKLVFNPDASEDSMFSTSTNADSMGGTANINMTTLSAEAVGSGVVYIPCTPAVWPDGICLRYKSHVGAIPAVLTKDKEVKVERGHILPIGDFSSKIRWDYYVSADASEDGSGLSESDPMTLDRLQSELFTPAVGKIAWGMRLDGATVNLAPGEYGLSSTLAFPVPAAGGEYRLEVEGNGAVIDGGTESSGSDDKMLTVSKEGVGVMSVGQYSHIVLKNLVIQNGYATHGAGVSVNYTSVATDANSSLECRGCRFLRNIAYYDGGGAVYVAPAAAGGVLTFDGCVFQDNQTLVTQGGGTLYTDEGKVAAMFNRCSFIKNKGGKNGLDIFMNNASARLGLNNCTFNSVNFSDKANGATVTNKGYTVIANSTIWASSCIGKWGALALGSSVQGGDPAGSTVVSSVIRNGTGTGTLPALYIHESYYQNIKNCIYTGANLNSAVAGNTYTIDSDSYDAGIGGAFESPDPLDALSSDVPYMAYTWGWTDGYPCPTLAQVRSAIAGTTVVGPMFLRWLDTMEDALTVDIAGRPRNENAICPGSYQQTTTPEAGDNAAGATSLRVMSFNILREDLNGPDHLWTKRKEAVLQMLSVNAPDVIGLQECSWTTRKDILDADPRRKAIGTSVSGLESGYVSESSNSIIYRSDLLQAVRTGMFWLSDTPDQVSYTWNADKPRVCTWARFKVLRTGSEFYHFNVHIHNGTTEEINENRRKSIELILERIEAENTDGLPVFITGDHNAPETSDELKYTYMYSDFRSARAVAADSDTGRTLNSFNEKATSVIDHIYINAGFTALRFMVDRNPYAGVTYISDHYPVICDMRVKENKFVADLEKFQFDSCDAW